MKIRITKEFNFEMAHALLNYNGMCKNIHGHSYKLFVTVIGEIIEDDQHPNNGMVIDFKELKRLVKEVVNQYDHSLLVNQNISKQLKAELMNNFDRVICLPYQPTCENLLSTMAQKINNDLPEGIDLHNLKLQETQDSYAEWYQQDNQGFMSNKK